MEELRNMIGEPVWIERNDGGCCGWWLVSDFRSIYGVAFATMKGMARLYYDDFGKKWFACNGFGSASDRRSRCRKCALIEILRGEQGGCFDFDFSGDINKV